MIYKLLIAGAGLAASYILARKLSEVQSAEKVKVKAKPEEQRRSARLRQDPRTGVYYPED